MSAQSSAEQVWTHLLATSPTFCHWTTQRLFYPISVLQDPHLNCLTPPINLCLSNPLHLCLLLRNSILLSSLSFSLSLCALGVCNGERCSKGRDVLHDQGSPFRIHTAELRVSNTTHSTAQHTAHRTYPCKPLSAYHSIYCHAFALLQRTYTRVSACPSPSCRPESETLFELEQLIVNSV